MPYEARRVRLAEIAADVPNAIAAGPFGSNLVSRDYVESGVPVIRGQNLAGRWVSGDFAFVSDEKAERLKTNTARPGDIVFTQRGTLGQVSVVPTNTFPRYVVSQSQMKLTVDSAKADARYVYYACTAQDFVAQVHNNAVAAGVPHINLGTLRSLEIPLPEIEQQVAAADTLSSIDDRIDLLRKTNATLESIAQALFKSWFIDFDPVRAKAEGREPEGMDAATAALFPAEFEESALGWIPKGWSWSSLGALCASAGGWIQTGPFGSQLHASDYVEEGIPVVMPQDMQDRRVSDARVARVRSCDADRLAKHKLAVGDIVFSRRGDVGRHATVSEREVGWLCGTGCLLVRPGVGAKSPAYLSQALAHPQSVEWLKRHAVGATMPNLNTGILEALPLLSPTDAVLDAFERTVGSLEQRITLNHAHASSLDAVRNQLLPRLISGKLRLPEAQVPLEDALA